MTRAWWKKEIEESIYLGWRGLGPILGTRYYLNIGEDTIRLMSRYPLGGFEVQYFPSSAIICTDARHPSMVYSIFGAVFGFFGDLFKAPDEIMDIVDVVRKSHGFVEFINAILVSLVVAVLIGTVLDRLFERPRINLILEGGIVVGTFTNFKKRMPQTLREISVARGINLTESM